MFRNFWKNLLPNLFATQSTSQQQPKGKFTIAFLCFSAIVNTSFNLILDHYPIHFAEHKYQEKFSSPHFCFPLFLSSKSSKRVWISSNLSLIYIQPRHHQDELHYPLRPLRICPHRGLDCQLCGSDAASLRSSSSGSTTLRGNRSSLWNHLPSRSHQPRRLPS